MNSKWFAVVVLGRVPVLGIVTVPELGVDCREALIGSGWYPGMRESGNDNLVQLVPPLKGRHLLQRPVGRGRRRRREGERWGRCRRVCECAAHLGLGICLGHGSEERSSGLLAERRRRRGRGALLGKHARRRAEGDRGRGRGRRGRGHFSSLDTCTD